jgi:hypothetical protein
VTVHVPPVHPDPGPHQMSELPLPLVLSVTDEPTSTVTACVHGALHWMPAGVEETAPDPGPNTRVVTVSVACGVQCPLRHFEPVPHIVPQPPQLLLSLV